MESSQSNPEKGMESRYHERVQQHEDKKSMEKDQEEQNAKGEKMC
eukprot:CAMPEP_0202475828 /NCGR_PEP_ID=MMETSP1360-20130828/93104_1 /ASSEMBLY_ACC=CAM_ASM_000848 /TAXON_ID=515479 /ORGANISM="Licmophora paradoxa, Strain CCMP2313" /LENGTH=44 /DNA_ID= /DNA_START= /DNA_END= /DNA_ORIENTATION=